MIYAIGHMNPDTDSICAAIAYADFAKKYEKLDVVPARIGDINPETEFVLKKFGFEAPVMLKKAKKGDQFILVDHNATDETLEGLEEDQVIRIIDHHKHKALLRTPRSIWVEPWGSTSTMIAMKYRLYEIEIPKDIAGLLLSAILSDTVVFKSPTTAEIDKKIAEELAKIAGIENLEEFGIEIKKQKTDFSRMSAKEIITMDYKEFSTAGKKYAVGQVEIVDEEEIGKRKDEIIKEMENIQKEKGLDFITLMVTNIMKEGTDFWAVGDVTFMEKAFGGRFEESSLYVKGVMSRKKQVIVPIDEALSS